MIGMKRVLSIFLLAGLLPWSAFSAEQQNSTDNAEVEKLRLQAQEEAQEASWDTRIIPVRYVDLRELRNALSMFRAKMQTSEELHVLSVRAPKEIMPAIEDAIHRLDVPQPRKEAELTIYVVVGTDQQEAAAAIPASLNPVMNQLKGVLAYKGYRLLDTLLVRGGNSNNTSLTGTLSLSDAVKPIYRFTTQFHIENDGKAPLLHLGNMSFSLQGPIGAAISGDVQIPQSQQVVVGKATLGDKALILVMSAKFD